jgi:hypothetical protein
MGREPRPVSLGTGAAMHLLGGATSKHPLLARIRAYLMTPPPPPRRHFSKSWGYK